MNIQAHGSDSVCWINNIKSIWVEISSRMGGILICYLHTLSVCFERARSEPPRAFLSRGAEMRGVDKLRSSAPKLFVCLSRAAVKKAGRDKLSKVAIKYGKMLVAHSGD